MSLEVGTTFARDTETGEVWRIGCNSCLHRRSVGFCAAFPDPPGIPGPIISGEWDHREPVEGDRGIRWEPKPGEGVTRLPPDGRAGRR